MSVVTPTAVAGDVPSCHGVRATIIGTKGDDDLRGTSGDDVIVTFKGDDRVESLEGDDHICSGAGNDWVFGGPGNDRISDTGFGHADGGPDNDVIFGFQSAVGEGGDDAIRAGPVERDVGLYGGDGDDILVGGDFNSPEGDPDELEGGPGNDVLRGHNRLDIFWPGPGDDRIYGGAGRDAVFYANSIGPVRVDLRAGQADGEGHDELFSIAIVEGSAFGDHLTGDAEDNHLDGCGGNDTLYGMPGDDVLLGDPDILPVEWCPGPLGADVIFGGEGVDHCTGEIRQECESP